MVLVATLPMGRTNTPHPTLPLEGRASGGDSVGHLANSYAAANRTGRNASKSPSNACAVTSAPAPGP